MDVLLRSNSMIRKVGTGFSEKIMLKQRDQHMMFDQQVQARTGEPSTSSHISCVNLGRSECTNAALPSVSPGGGRARFYAKRNKTSIFPEALARFLPCRFVARLKT